MIPKTIAIVQRAKVMSIMRFFLKQVCKSVLKCQEHTSHNPSTAAMSPVVTWVSVTITVVSARFIVAGLLKNAPSEGIMTTIMDIMWSITAESIVMACCLYFFWFFRTTALSIITRTIICMIRLIVDVVYIKVKFHP